MSIRNYIFRKLGESIQIQTQLKFAPFVPSLFNKELQKAVEAQYQLQEGMREIHNTQEISLSEMNEVEAQEYKTLSLSADSEVDGTSPYGVLHQVDKYEFLHRIKLMEERPGDFKQSEIQAYRLLGKVFLEEENALQKLEEHVEKYPQYKHILGQADYHIL